MENKYLTVTALNRYIAYKFDTDNALRSVYLKGEISNFRISGGHLYFSLKDETSEIRAIMFASQARILKFMPADGMTVLVEARVTVYQKNGTYSLTVNSMNEVGLGEYYLNFLKLKEKLQKEGLFDEEKKLPLPEFPKNVGVITSATGDAINDILTTIQKRFPLTKVYLYPALVQGTEAPKSLIRQIERANADHLCDVLIIARGGGSAEDLSCFNDEELARTIFGSKIPTVSGVGHEADFTICDFVASRRAPTPTGAAVLVTRDQAILARTIMEKMRLIQFYYKKTLEQKYYQYQTIIGQYYFRNFAETITAREKEVERLTYNLNAHSPLSVIVIHERKVGDLEHRLRTYNIQDKIKEKLDYVTLQQQNMQYYLQVILKTKEQRFEASLDKMVTVNPLNLLKKGYALTYQDNRLITGCVQIETDKDVKIKYYDGELIAKPIRVNEGNKG